ncbi:MAG: hypothetical protein RLZZ511_2209 [Cyanobacteriota bacterium]|jgi:hypothetical protein
MDAPQTQRITRQQLLGYGMSRYHAVSLTQTLTNQGKSSNHAYLYAVPEVIQSIRSYLERSRLKVQSREQLEKVLQQLIKQLGNLVNLPFQAGEVSELGKMTKELMKSMSRTDQALSKLTAQAAHIKGKYRK